MAESEIRKIEVGLINSSFEVSANPSQAGVWSLECEIRTEDADSIIQEIKVNDISLAGTVVSEEISVDIDSDKVNVMDLDVNVTVDGVNSSIVESQVVPYSKIITLSGTSAESVNEKRYASSAWSAKKIYDLTSSVDVKVDSLSERIENIEAGGAGISKEIEERLKRLEELSFFERYDDSTIKTKFNLFSEREISSSGLNKGTGGSGEGGGSETLDGLLDVMLITPKEDDVLIYNGTHWVNKAKSSIAPELDLTVYLLKTEAERTYAKKSDISSFITADALSPLKSDIQSINGAVASLSGEIVSIAGNVSALSKSTENISGELDDVKEDVKTLDEGYATVTGDITSINESLEQINSSLNNFQKVFKFFHLTDDEQSVYTTLNFYSEKEISSHGLSIGRGGGASVVTFDDIIGVSLSDKKSGDVLVYNGTHWVNIPQSTLVPDIDLSGYATKTFVEEHDSALERSILSDVANTYATTTYVDNKDKALQEAIDLINDWFVLEDGVLHTKYNIASDLEISAYGINKGTGGGGGSSFSRLDSWSDYDKSKAGYVLSALLGYDLHTRIIALENAEVDLSDYYTKSQTDAKISSAISGINFAPYATKEELNNAISGIDFTPYATTKWVEDKKYITAEALSPYATTYELNDVDKRVTTLEGAGYATVKYVDTSISKIDFSPYAKSNDVAKTYATKTELSSSIEDLNVSQYAKSTEVANTYATKKELSSAIAGIDFAPYATKKELSSAIEGLNISQYAKAEDVADTYATKTALSQLQGAHDTLRGEFNDLNALLSSDTSGYINTWQEVVAFLDGYKDEDDLAAILSGMQSDINSRHKTSEFNDWVEKTYNPLATRVGTVESGVASNLSAINGLTTRVGKNETSIKDLEKRLGLFEQVIHIDTENEVIGVDYDFYSAHEISSHGLNKGEGGGGGSSYSRLDTWDGYDSAKAGYVLSAGLGHGLKISIEELQGYNLNGRIQTIENSYISKNAGGVINGGLVVTSLAISGGRATQFVKADGSLDSTTYLSGITSAMVVSALGYTPFNTASFTKDNIKSTLGISDWAMASSKPSYKTSEITEETNLFFTNSRAISAVSGSYIAAKSSSGYDVDACYDAGLYMVKSGSNVPSGSNYGALLSLPYRKAKGNSIPDFGTQIFLPNGDDDTNPNDMYFRTSLSGSWNNWQMVLTTSNLTKQLVIDALDYTPYDSSNPSGFITSAALSGYLPLSGGYMEVGKAIRWNTQSGKTPYLGQYATDGSFLISIEGTSTNYGLVLGGTSGNLLWKGQRVLDASNYTTYVQTAGDTRYLKLAGGTLTGALTTTSVVTPSISTSELLSITAPAIVLYGKTTAEGELQVTEALSALATLDVSNALTVGGWAKFNSGASVEGGNLVTKYDISVNKGKQIFWTDTNSVKHGITYDESAGAFKVDGKYIATGSGASLSWGEITGKPTVLDFGGTSSQFLKADGSLDSTSYLSTSGGTIGGISSDILTLDTSSPYDESRLIIKHNGANKTFFGWSDIGSYLYNATSGCWIGIKDDGTPNYNNYTLIHSGNIGSQSVSYATSSACVTGSTLKEEPINTLTVWETWGNADNELNLGQYSYGVQLNSPDSYYGFLLGAEAGTGTLSFNVRNSNVWGGWKTLIHSGNILNYAVGHNNHISLENEVNVLGYGYADGGWTASGSAFIVGASKDWRMAFQGYTDHDLKFNYCAGGTWGTWRKIAFTDSDITGNAATATKLIDNTAYTAWGNTFFQNGKPIQVDSNYLFLNPTGSGIYFGRNVVSWHDKGDWKKTIFYFNEHGGVTYGEGDIAEDKYKLVVSGNTHLGITFNEKVTVGDTYWGIRAYRHDSIESCIQSGVHDGSSNFPLCLNPNGGIVRIGTMTENGTYAALQVGGSLSAGGMLTIQSGYDGKIVLDNNDSESKWQYISFCQNGERYGDLGTFGNNDLKWRTADDKYDTLIHSGNIAYQSVANAAEATHATSADYAVTASSASKAVFADGTTYLSDHTDIIYFGSNGFPKRNIDIIAHQIQLRVGSTSTIQTGFIINQSGKVGIGTTNPKEKLHVDGVIRAKDNVLTIGTHGGYALYGGVREGEAFSLETYNTDASWQAWAIRVTMNGAVTLANDLTIKGSLSAGATSLSSLTVSGDTALGNVSASHVHGNGSILYIGNSTNASYVVLYEDMRGSTDMWRITRSGNANMTSLALTSNASITGTLGVTGDVTVNNVTINGTLGVNQTAFFKAIQPLSNNAYVLGESYARWQTIYGQNLDIAGTSTMNTIKIKSGQSIQFEDANGALHTLRYDSSKEAFVFEGNVHATQEMSAHKLNA